jgi:CheY-like chemotaxis protein
LHPLLEAPHERADALREAALDAAAVKPNLAGIRVLVVDDQEDSVEIVRRVLERNGGNVCTARSMDEALKAFANFSPDVLLSDIGLPNHDGYELIARLRSLPGGRRVPAVALTALARSEDRNRALRAGFQMHIAKPVDFAELITVVQNLAALRNE